MVASQCITTIGIVENLSKAGDSEELARLTAKRSVFSVEDLDAMEATSESPVRVIDFLLVGHLQQPLSLDTLLEEGVFSGYPPQSITQFSEEKFQIIRSRATVGPS
jgi:hypothetical protein